MHFFKFILFLMKDFEVVESLLALGMILTLCIQCSQAIFLIIARRHTAYKRRIHALLFPAVCVIPQMTDPCWDPIMHDDAMHSRLPEADSLLALRCKLHT